jgi:hypothetical protein
MQDSRYSKNYPETHHILEKELTQSIWLREDGHTRTRVFKERKFDEKLKREYKKLRENARRFQSNESAWNEFRRMNREEMNEVIRRAKLTPTQRTALILRSLGHSYSEMSKIMKCSRQFCCTCYLIAVKRLKPAIETFPYLGLSEVYRQEQMRGSSWT